VRPKRLYNKIAQRPRNKTLLESLAIDPKGQTYTPLPYCPKCNNIVYFDINKRYWKCDSCKWNGKNVNWR